MEKYISGIIAGVMSFFAPVEPLLLCAMTFVAVDFLTGVLADRRRARTEGGEWHFESRKAWHTITKLCFVMAGIVLAWMMDSLLLPIANLRLANIFTGFVCGVEFWSYLENATIASGAKTFAEFADYVKKMVKNILK